MGKLNPSDLLPEITVTKSFAKRQKLREKKKLRELQRENPRAAARLEQAKAKKALAAKKAGPATATGGKTSRAKKSTTAASDTAKKAKKTRRPKTVVANAPTGRETLVKKKARELIKEQKKTLKAARVAAGAKVTASEARGESNGRVSSRQGESSPVPEPVDADRLLIARTVLGGDAGDGATLGGRSLVAQDPTLYPTDVAFYADYAERRLADTVSEDELLKKAHDHFRKVGQEERRMNVAAAKYLQKMKEANRKGGDRDGFRYVLPRNVKSVVKMMRQNAQLATGASSDSVVADEENLVSTFGGDDENNANDRPVRRRKRRESTFSDFYQFQVSKQWTKNAESFLSRGRAHKSLFEAKKRQRNIKKL